MANRALWSGSMGIGVVLLPIKAYKAVDTAKEGLSLSLLHKDDLSPLRRPFICLECGKEVGMNTDCIHGYKEGDKYVVLTDEDMTRLPLASSVNIKIEGFIKSSVPDPRMIVDHYVVAPDPGKGKTANNDGIKLFVLFTKAMEDMGVVGIGKWGYAKRERLVSFTPFGGVLLMQELHWDAELRDFTDLVPDAPVEEKALPLAKTLISQMVKEIGEDIPWLVAGISYPLEEKPMTLREARNTLFYLTGLVRRKGEKNAKQLHSAPTCRGRRVQKQSRFNL
jgi:DNA end-binding protein Ku